MIEVTRRTHERLLLNVDHIQMAEANPDTVLTLINGDKLVVAESTEEIVERIVAFRRRIACRPNVPTLVWQRPEAEAEPDDEVPE